MKRKQALQPLSLMDLPGQFKRIKKQAIPRMMNVLKSGRYILGPEVELFEKEFAKFCHVKHCIGTGSGTESLILALRALNIGSGDEVITVPNTFTATAEAIALVGARVVFCDIDPDTKNLDPDACSKRLTKKTKAIIPVHLHGNPVDMDRLYEITRPRRIAVIEDAAQAHGARYKGKVIGSLPSECASFSFHPVKNLGSFGDAGALVTNDDKLAATVRLMINHGRTGHNRHILIGTTGRMDALQAAVLIAKLPYLSGWREKRERFVSYYKKRLPNHCKTISLTPHSESAHHVFAILVPHRDTLAAFLEKNNVEVGMHYPIPLHLQKAYAYLGYRRGDFPHAEHYAAQTLSLPLYPHMKFRDIDRVVTLIKAFYER